VEGDRVEALHPVARRRVDQGQNQDQDLAQVQAQARKAGHRIPSGTVSFLSPNVSSNSFPAHPATSAAELAREVAFSLPTVEVDTMGAARQSHTLLAFARL
jgi:hypothetical protein